MGPEVTLAIRRDSVMPLVKLSVRPDVLRKKSPKFCKNGPKVVKSVDALGQSSMSIHLLNFVEK